MAHERPGASAPSAQDQEPSLPPPPPSSSHTTNLECEIPLRHPSPGAAYRRHRSSRSQTSQDSINVVVPATVPVPCPSALPAVLHGSRAESERRHRSSRSRNSQDSINVVVPATVPVHCPSAFAAVRHGSRADFERLAASQRELSDTDARVVYVGDPDRTDPGLELVGNAIRTAKYSLLAFLPRNLFEQFHRLAYVYFLVIAALNQLPQLAVFGRGASVLPLSLVLLVSAVKDAYEDWRRHSSDGIENFRAASVLDPVARQFRSKPWKDVRVGEVVKVHADETIPCDMVILTSSDPTGIAFVQTINLDGESNLKTRYAKHETMFRHPDAVHFSGGLICCEQPNRNIYGFLANMEVDAKRVSLGPSNIVLRGCELKNTAWVVGVAVYAGCETKVMLNSSGAPSKRSRLETRMNRETLLLSAILIFLCSVVSVYDWLWLGEHREDLELAHFFRKRDYSAGVENYNYYGVGKQVFFTFLMSVIVFQIMIPISLYISMELVRLGQAYFMIWDANLYDEGSKSRFQCRALNINEDLGQIKYVFSDKTGTLTENKMVFQCASIHGKDYSGGKAPSSEHNEEVTRVLADDGQILRPKMPVRTDPELVKLLSEGDNEQGQRAREFFFALACCNTIVPLVVEASDPKQKLIDYQGESPDEQALVYAAASYGFVLVERTSGHIVIDALGDRQRYEVLGLHEFDSDRKRMSVIIRSPDKTVKLYMKGADSSMLGIIEKTEDLDIIHATETNLHAYSSFGLRTLVVGVRNLSRNDFEEWQCAYDHASTALIGRGRLLRAVASNVERCLDILGASAIEDKLQQGVPEAIQSMRLAGIKVWVLTGDKQETAISIGFSCKLLTAEMTQIVINSNSEESCKRSLKDAVAICSKLTAMSTEKTLTGSRFDRIPKALIIDGTSLVYILETDLQEELFKVATACEAVLCCRVAPLQKAGIVALIKNRTDDMTLAIGDGANDVSMIQMADVGIGISGQEGRQAVMASDFAMGQFRFLVPLLLVHGHWNYQRMAYMILYNFYRNAVFVFILFWYVLYTAYSLTTAITEWSSVLYSIVYTALPTIIVGILDKDLNRGTLMKYPQLYRSGQKNERYNLKLFILTMVDCIWQSLAIFYIPYLAYKDTIVDGCSLGDLWTLAVVIVVNIHLAMDVYRWNWITHATIWGCIVATVVSVIVIDSLRMLPSYWAIFHIIGTGLFWLCLFGILIAGIVPRFTTKVLTEFLMPSDIQIAREVEKFREAVATSKTSSIALSQP